MVKQSCDVICHVTDCVRWCDRIATCHRAHEGHDVGGAQIIELRGQSHVPVVQRNHPQGMGGQGVDQCRWPLYELAPDAMDQYDGYIAA